MVDQSSFLVYILENSAGRFSIGQTEDLQRRVSENNDQGPSLGKYTLKNGPWKLVWSE
jgi:predicted GIY-YIG superfamily endonuclease